MINWDPGFPGEGVDWYGEYVARHSCLSMSWLQQPKMDSQGSKEKLEIRGLGLLSERDKVIAPLDDGSVCFWNLGKLGDPSPQDGRIVTRSRPGLLSFDNGQKGSERWQSSATSNIKIPSSGVVECYGLNEVDLTTLQISAYDRYPQPISTLSEAAHLTPLTIGTTQALFIHDPRLGNNGRTSPYTTLGHCMDEEDFRHLHSGGSTRSGQATLAQPLPLSILHLPHTIYVAGRFPSILTYDRRYFPKMLSNIHSGARLSTLTCLQTPHSPTIVAAGDYNGKGSLEKYPLSSSDMPGPAPTRNRTSASRSKILSLAPHGKRLLFSDSDGQLKWVERDGTTLVRRWNINTYSSESTADLSDAPQGIFNASSNDGDVARKLLPVDKERGVRYACGQARKLAF